MMVPAGLQYHLKDSLKQSIDSAEAVSGGSINQAARLVLEDGSLCFLKWNTSADPDMFYKEQQGLELLKKAGTSLRIPRILNAGVTNEGTGYLLLEFIEQDEEVSGSAATFGEELAQLHSHTNERFGLAYDNYIGRLPQSNSWHGNWIEFFIKERLQPQLQQAIDSGKLGADTAKHFEALYGQLPLLLPEEPASLLHGDLWGGNYLYDSNGTATLVDPAVYYGHREIELAFTHLFGGFPERFYKAYHSAYPLAPEFSSRKDIYNLYPLLVHTNLFGGHYGRQVQNIVKRF